MALLASTSKGLYCAAGDFYIDPWRAVDRALITHAHSDHARPGHAAYLCAGPGGELLAERVGHHASIEALPYGASRLIGEVRVSFHPAGHILGSAQIRLEHRGEVWVASGDFKTQDDPTCEPFAPVKCHVFLTESTFGLPVYRWSPPDMILQEINQWWRHNQARKRISVLLAYSLGKAQRVLAGLDPGAGTIFVHPRVMQFLPAYERAGVRLPSARPATSEALRGAGPNSLLLAPPTADLTRLLRGPEDASTAMASGWMQLRGSRRRSGLDRGFAISDHADWNGLIQSIAATEAERVLVTHGFAHVLVRWLKERGRDAAPLKSPFKGEPTEAGTHASQDDIKVNSA